MICVMATAVLDRGVVQEDRQRETLAQIAREEFAEGFKPPPVLTVSEWADTYRIVPSYSAEPGRWVTAKTPYLREIMDSFSDPSVNKVVFMKCARIGATEAGLNVIGFFIHQEPSPIFIVQPAVDDAKDFSKEQLAPTVEETPELRARVSDQSSRESGNTIQAKLFPGGALYIVGANSPRGFRRRTARVIILEEVDGYPPSAGTEGDQVKLAERRATTYQHRRKVYINSSPSVKGPVEEGGSRVEAEFLASDQRRYFVPCPDCGHEQVLVWGQLRWDGDAPPEYCCTGCGVLIPETHKFSMVQAGRWIATNPGPATRGYHLNAMYSPWVTWGELRDEFVAAGNDPGKLQVFVNTALGETWEDRGNLGPAEGLMGRREVYETSVPAGVRYVTMGVDVQPDRIEYVARGWGAGEEAWLLDRGILLGDPTIPEEVGGSVWAQLSTARTRWGVQATCIDSGFNADSVYRYAKPRYLQRVWVTRGYSEPGKPLVTRRPSKNNRAKCPVFYVGTDTGKDSIYGRLKIALQGPLYWHFPIAECAGRDYFEQLTAEKKVRKQVNGRWTTAYVCPPGRRNEVLDCEVLALVALRLANPSLERPAEDDGDDIARPTPAAAEWTPPAPVAPQSPSSGRHVKNLRRVGTVGRW